jgi:hypothetical protein
MALPRDGRGIVIGVKASICFVLCEASLYHSNSATLFALGELLFVTSLML